MNKKKEIRSEKNRGPSRRQFVEMSSMAGLGAVLGINSIPSVFDRLWHSEPDNSDDVRVLHIHPRYHRWFVDPGVEWIETNTGYASLDWNIPASQVAIVLVDVWQRHYLKDTEDRAETIINSSLVPLLSACRKSGINIIHAPSPEVAALHPNWVKLQSKAELQQKRDDWPPAEFLNSTGPYKSFAMPFEPREEERNNLPALTFHPLVKPVGKEPVVATGEELHRYCKQNRILFLLFAGFNTNACILVRDYGTLQMRNRGYSVVVVRDCTTGMESKETQPTLSQTNGAILFLEMFGHFSVTSGDIISGLPVPG
jgi:nicotinamidase-related amidase